MPLTVGHTEEEGEWAQDMNVMQTFIFQRKPVPRNVEKRVQVTLSAGGRTEMYNSSFWASSALSLELCCPVGQKWEEPLLDLPMKALRQTPGLIQHPWTSIRMCSQHLEDSETRGTACLSLACLILSVCLE